MAETDILNATARTGTGKGAARSARREGLVPGVIYGGGEDPVTINLKYNELLKMLKAGRFHSKLLTVSVEGKQQQVICRGVQRDIVKDLPTHVDFLRLGPRSRINLYIPVEFINEEKAPGIRRGGVLNVVRPEVELKVTAGSIPEKLVADLDGMNVGDTLTISRIALPEGTQPVITNRDFVIATIAAPSGLRASEAEEAEGGEEGEED